MKVTVYSLREFDERQWFDKFSRELGIELVVCHEAPNLENAYLAKGSSCISIITTPISKELMKKFYEYGVRFISTRTIGYDHIDMDAAKEIGITVGNTPYGPHGVADYTLMLMLMSIRKMNCIMERASIQDFTLKGIQGKELSDFTVGVIGTGRIGKTVVNNLSGFGCKILAYDKYESEDIKDKIKYVDLDTLYKESDLITLHTPLFEENFHMINKESIEKMKDGVIIINTARGGLIDSDALIDALESKKVGAAALDVIENEFSLYYYDRKSDIIGNRELALLKGFPNVIVTPHMAFYTDNYIITIVRDTLRSCKAFLEKSENKWIVE
ncbi:MAG: lactate dehydrogenase [Clostridiales bacterium]|nr:lactate dehydrogenase [Clostridiales bacterium]